MRFRVVEKDGTLQKIDSVKFDASGRIEAIRTTDAKYLSLEDVDWDIDIEEDDIDTIKLNLWVLGEKAPFAKFGLRLEEEKNDSIR